MSGSGARKMGLVVCFVVGAAAGYLTVGVWFWGSIRHALLLPSVNRRLVQVELLLPVATGDLQMSDIRRPARGHVALSTFVAKARLKRGVAGSHSGEARLLDRVRRHREWLGPAFRPGRNGNLLERRLGPGPE